MQVELTDKWHDCWRTRNGITTPTGESINTRPIVPLEHAKRKLQARPHATSKSAEFAGVLPFNCAPVAITSATEEPVDRLPVLMRWIV
jgi:hypothetical protein